MYTHRDLHTETFTQRPSHRDPHTKAVQYNIQRKCRHMHNHVYSTPHPSPLHSFPQLLFVTRRCKTSLSHDGWWAGSVGTPQHEDHWWPEETEKRWISTKGEHSAKWTLCACVPEPSMFPPQYTCQLSLPVPHRIPNCSLFYDVLCSTEWPYLEIHLSGGSGTHLNLLYLWYLKNVILKSLQ